MKKQYEISVYSKAHSGGEKAEEYTKARMVLPSTSIKNAKEFALDVIAGLTFGEVYEEDEDTISWLKTWCNAKMSDTIGYEHAEKHFAIRANILK